MKSASYNKNNGSDRWNKLSIACVIVFFHLIGQHLILISPHWLILRLVLTEQEEMLTGRLPGKYSTEDASYVHVRPGETAATPG